MHHKRKRRLKNSPNYLFVFDLDTMSWTSYSNSYMLLHFLPLLVLYDLLHMTAESFLISWFMTEHSRVKNFKVLLIFTSKVNKQMNATRLFVHVSTRLWIWAKNMWSGIMSALCLYLYVWQLNIVCFVKLHAYLCSLRVVSPEWGKYA